MVSPGKFLGWKIYRAVPNKQEEEGFFFVLDFQVYFVVKSVLQNINILTQFKGKYLPVQ